MAVLSGRVALVTGASSGLGERFAETLAVRVPRWLSPLGGEMAGTTRRALGVSPSRRRHHFTRSSCGTSEMFAERFGRLDILVNNAGICDEGPLEDETLEEITTVIQTDLVAVIDLCRLMAPLLFQSDAATVINVASIYGLVASHGPMVAYNASKGALINLTRHLAAQWGARGVPRECTCAGLLSNRINWRAQRSQLRGEHRDQIVVGADSIHRRAGRPTLVSGIGPRRATSPDIPWLWTEVGQASDPDGCSAGSVTFAQAAAPALAFACHPWAADGHASGGFGHQLVVTKGGPAQKHHEADGPPARVDFTFGHRHSPRGAAAWWLLWSPSPATNQASHWLFVARLSCGRFPHLCPMALMAPPPSTYVDA